MKRVVFTSSIVAVGTSTDPTDIRDESRWNEEPINLYYRAKTESERRVHQLAAETGIEVVIVNPAMVLGGRDFRLTPSMRYARDLLRGIIITIPSGLNVVSVQDVVAAHIAGRIGAEQASATSSAGIISPVKLLTNWFDGFLRRDRFICGLLAGL